MSKTGMAGTPGQEAGPTLSRRRVLQLGAAALPALCGARLLARRPHRLGRRCGARRRHFRAGR